MISNRLLLVAATALATACAASAFAQSPAATGLDAWKAVVGNTIVGKSPTGEAQIEYFMADGVVKNKIDGDRGEGEWSLRGAKLCTDYSDDDDDKEDGEDKENDSGQDEDADCYSMLVLGDVLTLTDDSGKAREFKILPGNPEKL